MYYLIVTEEQAKVISKALDLFARIGICQFEEILKHPTWQEKIFKGEVNHNALNEARDLIARAKYYITGEPANAGPSIVASDEHNRIAYDLLQVIEHTLAEGKHLPNGHVARREPMKWADHHLASMRKIPYLGAGAAHVGDPEDEVISVANLPEEFTIKDPKTYTLKGGDHEEG